MAIAMMSHDQRQDMSAAAMRSYPNIVRDWQLKEQEAALLLGVPGSTYRRWQKHPEKAALDVNQLERMSLILGIYKALQILLPRSDAADSWLRRPNRNPLFSGQAPLERLRSGLVSDLYVVRQYLDAARGGSHA
ncbi:MbcA/ParS/Xre antitoxin family protein [Salinicola halimionae]|uniref:MbcA/ParS/Xre antitoxin family protein n=1 Tax=Salinicola halimionae TaxID=1949081 RepID=UPI000DA20627|nr:MbcA/ParS/Xre antitoxin family protein [Salinicola halimionae]